MTLIPTKDPYLRIWRTTKLNDIEARLFLKNEQNISVDITQGVREKVCHEENTLTSSHICVHPSTRTTQNTHRTPADV